MSSSDRDRFLIALAKFLGENPTHPAPHPPVCETWLLDEVVAEIIPQNDEFHFDLEKFNRLMLNYGRRLSTPHFYDYFFKHIAIIDDFEKAIEKFRVKAMWLFGNFEFGYNRIATSKKTIFDSLMEETESISSATFE